MGLLRTSSVAGQGFRELRGSRERDSTLGAAGAGFRPLCLRSLRPGHSRSRRAVPPEASDRAKAPRDHPPATPDSVSFSGLPLNPLASLPPGQPHPLRVGPQPRLSSLPVQLWNRKSERATRALRAHAQGHSEIPPAEPRQERASGPSQARHTSGTCLRLSRNISPPLFPQ